MWKQWSSFEAYGRSNMSKGLKNGRLNAFKNKTTMHSNLNVHSESGVN